MRRTLRSEFQRMSPALIVIYSFVVADLLGALLLSLPVSAKGPLVPPIDALFTATSSLCVTGLATVDIGTTFTTFGQIVSLILMELGGLGVMTFSVLLFLFLGRGFSTRGRWIINETFTAEPIKDVRSLLGSIFLFTFLVQLAGAVLLFFVFDERLSAGGAVFAGIYHSISAFCNCGLALFPKNFMDYPGNVLLNVTVCALIVLGGIGFPVIHEFLVRLKNLRRRKRTAVSLHSRMVLSMTAILIVAGALFVFFLERAHELAPLSTKERVLASIFQSITTRTAGFNTIDIGALGPATLFIMVILMFIGASPGSCGGGIKTTSFAVLVAIFNGRIRGRQNAVLFKRTIPDETVSRALSIFILSVFILTVGLLVLLVTQPEPAEFGFLTYLFESVSAFGTVGLSMGVTPYLTVTGKLTIILIMLLGRVGLLTVAYVVTSRRVIAQFRYGEEKVMIG